MVYRIILHAFAVANTLLVMNWVQTVCKGYEHMAKSHMHGKSKIHYHMMAPLGVIQRHAFKSINH